MSPNFSQNSSHNLSQNIVIHNICHQICHWIWHKIWWFTKFITKIVTTFFTKFSESLICSPNFSPNSSPNTLGNLYAKWGRRGPKDTTCWGKGSKNSITKKVKEKIPPPPSITVKRRYYALPFKCNMYNCLLLAGYCTVANKIPPLLQGPCNVKNCFVFFSSAKESSRTSRNAWSLKLTPI